MNIQTEIYAGTKQLAHNSQYNCDDIEGMCTRASFDADVVTK